MADFSTYRSRVGAVRPSHLMFTSGVGSIVDLPNFSVLVKGLDDWDYRGLGGGGIDDEARDPTLITEPRLLAAVQALLSKTVAELRPAPWMPGTDTNPNGQAARTGVPVMPFPGWMRCTACNLLARIDSTAFGFENDRPNKPHEARFFHECGKGNKKRLVVGARFVLACTAGHLDDFPYLEFVHHGGQCPAAAKPNLFMEDRGGNIGANVRIFCKRCGADRNIREAMGKRGRERLPYCRGRNPHLGTFTACENKPHVLVVGASNQWFPQTLSALAVPQGGGGELDAQVAKFWANLENLPGPQMLPFMRTVPPFSFEFEKWTDEEVWAAIERHRGEEEAAGGEQQGPQGYPDLLTPEWEIFSSPHLPEPTDDFTAYRDDEPVPPLLKGYFSDVVQVERLREVRAVIGFTRLDAPDPEDPQLVQRVPLARSRPTWVPASEVRGEGIFLRLPEELLTRWEGQVADSEAMRRHREAFGRFREYRYSARTGQPFDEEHRYSGWPGPRYYVLHTLSHLLIRTIALECGYNSASLAERIYAGDEDDPRGGILIYTAVPDAEGTLGGLVSLARPEELVRLTRRALAEAMTCSSDPLCSERLPRKPEDFLHGAACHVCLFVSETTCERGNRFLDRRFVVPIDDPALAVYPELP
ncbi:DrmB family protein [Sphaerimonospora mesophila]|uniref:DrmB family protein n=1 Tax=Sphaerimonospora mesophila TaxID=37483 RepID=UPI0006E44993